MVIHGLWQLAVAMAMVMAVGSASFLDDLTRWTLDLITLNRRDMFEICY